jgi:hypothetical protein
MVLPVFRGFRFRRRSKQDGRRADVPKASRLKERGQGQRASDDAGAFRFRMEDVPFD